MKYLLQSCIVLLTTVSLSVAQNNYLGGAIEIAGSWSAGLPDTPGNVGTGSISDNPPDPTNSLFIEQTGGTINTYGGSRTFTDGSWTVNATSVWQIRDLNTGGTQDFIVNGGDFSISRSINHAGDLLQINGGTLTLSRNLFNNNSSIEINGGIINLTGTGYGFLTNTGNYAINGGTITINDYFGFTSGGGQYTFGVGSAGSITADRFSGTRTAGDLNWLTGSEMSLTIASDDEWAESAWNNGYLTYNGFDNTTIGGTGATWAEVTTAGGLDGTYAFDYNSTTESLSLAAVPEPSTALLLFGGLAGLALLRRKRQ
jgi:hypothetical protein